MGLNTSKGNMYEFVTHTWNAIKGKCYHDCSYCYMKRWGKLNPVRLDKKEFKTNLGEGNFIFVGSSCDMFAEDIPDEWINEVLKYCWTSNNRYLFQTKNPQRVIDYVDYLPKHTSVCTTIETNRSYPDVMAKSPCVEDRAIWMNELAHNGIETYVTIEPMMDFDLKDMLQLIEMCLPTQVNIGLDSGNNNLPEPSKEKVLQLIEGITLFSTIDEKKNLKRLLG